MKIKKILVTMVAALLLMTMTVMGTLAYLTSLSSKVTNTFSVGKVKITLDEAAVDEYGVQEQDEAGKDLARVITNDYKIIPGHEYKKDPTIHVESGSEPCYLFAKVVDPTAQYQAATTIADQMKAKGWEALTGVTNVYFYIGVEDATTETEESNAKGLIVDARNAARDVVLFENFKLLGTMTAAEVTALDALEITIEGYAVQADGFDSAADAWAAASTSWNVTTPEQGN